MIDYDISQLRIDPISEHTVCISGPEVISIELHQFLLAVCERLRKAHFSEILQIVPAYHTITIILQGYVSSIEFVESLRRWIDTIDLDFDRDLHAYHSPLAAHSTSNSPLYTTHVLHVRYGGDFGPDLQEFAHAKGISPREVIDLHTSVDYYVYMIGFTAGFPYLGGLPEQLHHPRRDQPRVRVPAGSVGIGGAQTGVYPHEAPGGWHLIGLTDTTLFDVKRDPPSLIKPGDRVRFVEVSHD